jgi:hypothetical protein
MQRFLVMALALGTAGCTGTTQTLPAHWVADIEGLEPTPGDFVFDDLWLASATEGWIVGHPFMLHLADGGLHLTIVSDGRINLKTVHAFPGDAPWVGGSQRSRPGAEQAQAFIARFRDGQFEPSLLPPLAAESAIRLLRFASPTDGWAVAAVGDDPRTISNVLLHYDGTAWRVSPVPTTPGRQVVLQDLCVTPAGAGWIVGREAPAPSGARSFILTRRGDAFVEVPLPDLGGVEARVERVECLPDGRPVITGHRRPDPQLRGGEGLLLTFDGEWTVTPFPALWYPYLAVAHVPHSAERVSMALGCVNCQGRFVEWSAGEWRELPAVWPEGRNTGFSIVRMQFASPGEGWAIANDVEGPGIMRGLIFQYRDGVWHHRNWNWHFWHQRWFGLLGH